MKKTVFTAFVGRPNVGKSSLINSLMNKEVLIVSKKSQTTRNKIAAIKTVGEEQFVFFDTPGLFQARDVLGQRMVKSIGLAIDDVDCAVLVVENKSEILKNELILIEKLKKVKIPVILAINKIDLIKNKLSLAPIVKRYNDLFDFSSTVFVSAKLKQGLEILISEIQKYEIASEHFFPNDLIIDKSEKFVVSEIFRQNLLVNLNEEIPHSLVVEVERMKKTGFGYSIELVIYCLKNNHKGIIIGKNGAVLKKVSIESRQMLEDFFGCRIYLQSWVKVKPKWKNNESFLNSLGF